MSLSNVKHIVLILSGKGGVGKSSVTTQLALSLSLSGYSVGILDLDLTGPSIPRLFNLESAKITQAPGGWLPVQVHPSQILPPLPPDGLSSEPNDSVSSTGAQNGASSSLSNGAINSTAPQSTDALTSNKPTEFPIGALYIISLALLLPSRSSAIIWRGPKKTAMVRQFLTDTLWPSLDYLLIDTPPGTSDEHISLVETLLLQTSPTTGIEKAHLAGAVIVTTPQAISISDVKKEINFCRKVGVRILGVVENMSGYVCECCGVATNLFSKGGGEVMSRDFGVAFLGSVPVDGQWGVLVEEGRRPRYGKVVKRGNEVGGEDDDVDEEDEEEEEEAGMDIDGGGGVEREAGLLVDKYRSCSLGPVFEAITRQVVGIVEAGG